MLLHDTRKDQRSRTIARETISSNAAVAVADKAKRREWAQKARRNKKKAGKAIASKRAKLQGKLKVDLHE